MIDQHKKNVLGVMVNAVDYEAALDNIITAARQHSPMAISALAVHGVMTGVLDKEHRYRLNNLDMVVPDGQPVRWAMNWLYRANLADRVYGPELMLRLCERAVEESLPIYLYGSSALVTKALSERLCSRMPKLDIAGCRPSFFRRTSSDERLQIVEGIRRSGATMVFVGLGCPRQEVWIHEYRDFLSMPLIAVGAAFDIHAGTLSQAPPILQRFGLEWFYRLSKEPRRLWRRYMLLNPLYVALLFLQLSRLVRIDPWKTIPPEMEQRYG